MPRITVSKIAKRRAAPQSQSRDELLALKNIGRAMRRDLELLGISTVAQLARREPDALYRALERRTGQRQDPCVWDTFAAAIHQARTGEARPWWHYTQERKHRQAEGSFPAYPRRRSP
jgi:Pathogenicity locus